LLRGRRRFSLVLVSSCIVVAWVVFLCSAAVFDSRDRRWSLESLLGDLTSLRVLVNKLDGRLAKHGGLGIGLECELEILGRLVVAGCLNLNLFFVQRC
jgi:hypothetical protein